MTELGRLIGAGRTAEVYAFGDGRVIKLLRPGFADDAAEEAAVAHRVEAAGLAAPRLIETVLLGGRPGLVYERVDGPSMLELILRDPSRVEPLATEFVALHAAMHAASGSGLPDLKEWLRAAIHRAELDGDTRDRILDRLAGLAEGDAICHGDMHPGNVVMTGGGPVVIDWVTATRGDPAADVARTVFLLRDSAGLDEVPAATRSAIASARHRFTEAYLDAYRPPLSVAAWRLPILAARLAERIEAERPMLLAGIAMELRQCRPAR